VATIKNRKKAALRGTDIVSRFPQGITVPTFWHREAGCRVVDIKDNPILLTDPDNKNDAWYVDIASLYEDIGNGLKRIKPEFANYPLLERRPVLILS